MPDYPHLYSQRAIWRSHAFALPVRYIFSFVCAEQMSAYLSVCHRCPYASHRTERCFSPKRVYFSFCAIISVIHVNIIVCRALTLLLMGVVHRSWQKCSLNLWSEFRLGRSCTVLNTFLLEIRQSHAVFTLILHFQSTCKVLASQLLLISVQVKHSVTLWTFLFRSARFGRFSFWSL